MQVPLSWLKEFVPIEATAEEVGARLTMGGLEVEGIEESEIGKVLDVYITPNRGDCLSIAGVARETAALYGVPLHIPAPPASSENGLTARETSVTIEDLEACPRFAARLIHGIKVGPSPKWMQEKLEAAGMRPINNVVDVTNYVMLELGQPLHAYDFDKLSERRIVVRKAKLGETIKTLDGVERELTPSMLVIADGEKPVSVAGVMGGGESEVSDSTTSLLIESAHFNPLSVRRTSRALGLRTEASYRFERMVDPNGVRRAVDRVCQLLQEMGQPEAVEGVVDAYPTPISPLSLSLRIKRCDALLGMEISSHMAADALRALQFEVLTEESPEGDVLKTLVPTFRADIALEEDLIEEVGRIYGYENIPERLPLGVTTQGGDSPLGEFLRKIRNELAATGLQEVVTHSLTPIPYFTNEAELEGRISVRNALSAEISGLRGSLLPTLLDVASQNATRGAQDLSLFEVGSVWRKGETEKPDETLAVAGLMTGQLEEAGWSKEQKPLTADFAAARGAVENLLRALHVANAVFEPLGNRAELYSQFHPGCSALIAISGEVIGIVGEAHPRFASKMDTKERVYLFEIALRPLQTALATDGTKFQALSRFQAVSRDLAPRIGEQVPFSSIESAVREANPEFLESFKLTDVYRGSPLPENVKSLTLSFTFRSPDRTLNETEIGKTMESLREKLKMACQATFA